MEKRERAKNKVREDQDLCEQRQKEIEMLMKNYQEIKKAKIDMDTKIREYHLFEVSRIFVSLISPVFFFEFLRFS